MTHSLGSDSPFALPPRGPSRMWGIVHGVQTPPDELSDASSGLCVVGEVASISPCQDVISSHVSLIVAQERFPVVGYARLYLTAGCLHRKRIDTDTLASVGDERRQSDVTATVLLVRGILLYFADHLLQVLDRSVVRQGNVEHEAAAFSAFFYQVLVVG